MKSTVNQPAGVLGEIGSFFTDVVRKKSNENYEEGTNISEDHGELQVGSPAHLVE